MSLPRTLDRESLREALPLGASAVVTLAKQLGYVRGRFNNGLEAIATPDGGDFIMPPTYTMRQADNFHRQWAMLPLIHMGR